MTKSQIEKCNQIAKYYGESTVLDVLCEESAEIIQASIKVRREFPDADNRLLDAVADLLIMLTEKMSFMDDDELTTLSKIINAKLDCQLDIIKKKGH